MKWLNTSDCKSDFFGIRWFESVPTHQFAMKKVKFLLKPCFLNKEYLVSDEGFVLNKKGTDKLHGSLNPRGYVIIQLMVNGKQKGVAEHTVVARAFCEGYKEGMQVNHKNGIHTDNRACNLEWVTPLENVRHSIEVLGYDHIGIKNPNAKKIYGYDLLTGELKYEFPCLIDCAKFLKSNATENQLRHVQNCISRVATGLRKSYLGIYWTHDKIDKIILKLKKINRSFNNHLLTVSKNNEIVFDKINYDDFSAYLQREYSLSKYRANEAINRCLNKIRKSYKGFVINLISD